VAGSIGDFDTKGYVLIQYSGGAGGIRTLDRALQPYNGLANRRLQPLGHSSDRADMPDAGVSRKRQIQGRRNTGLATQSFRRMFEVETGMRSRAFRLFRGLPFVSADQAMCKKFDRSDSIGVARDLRALTIHDAKLKKSSGPAKHGVSCCPRPRF
jgi:hypothetical protein